MFAVTKAQMERSRHTHARRQGNLNRVDLSFDLARSSDVCYHHTFDVLKPHLEDIVPQATDKQYSMKRREMIHDVLWPTGTHELCRKDEGPPVLGKRSAANPSSAQKVELMETFLAVHPFLVPMQDSFTYTILMVIFLSVLHLNGVPGYVFGEHFMFDRRAEGIDVLRFSACSRRLRRPQ